MKQFSKWSLLLIVLVELASYAGFFYPAFGNIVFIIAVIAAGVATFKKLEYGLYIMIGDLLLGSKSGALLGFMSGDFFLSFRMAFFVIFLSAWLLVLWRERRWPRFFSDRLIWAYGALGLVFILGIIRGTMLANGAANIFFDANAWLYFLLIFPVYETLNSVDTMNRVFKLISLGIMWLLVKSLLVLYFFSHSIIGPREDLYHWLMETATGQVALVAGRFYRVFLQSQMWAMAGVLVVGTGLLLRRARPRSFRAWAMFTGSLMLVLLSFSRSLWLGVVVALLVLGIVMVIMRWARVRDVVAGGLITMVLLAASWGAMQGVVDFPWPTVGADGGKAWLDRVSGLFGQAGGSTRLNQLAPLRAAISEHPIAGWGFGKELTYTTTDPKNILETVNAQFTTYAFEWGWLDWWLKTGLVGLLAYAVLIGILAWRLWHRACRAETPELRAWWLGWFGVLVALVTIHATTPYLNHPLGIGIIIIVTSISNKYLLVSRSEYL